MRDSDMSRQQLAAYTTSATGSDAIQQVYNELIMLCGA